MDKNELAEDLNSAVTEAFGRSPMTEDSLERVTLLMEEYVGKVLEDVLKENEELKEINYELLMAQIFDNFTRGLSLLQKEKLRSLAANLDVGMENPFEDYGKKLEALKDGLYPSTPAKGTGLLEDESFMENVIEEISPEMTTYYILKGQR